MVAHSCHPSLWEAEAGGLQIRDKSELQSEALSQRVSAVFTVAVATALGGWSHCLLLAEEAEGQRGQDWKQDTAERQSGEQTGTRA